MEHSHVLSVRIVHGYFPFSRDLFSYEVSTVSILYCAHLWGKCSLGISNFPKEISSLSPSVVFLNILALFTEEGLLVPPCYSLLLLLLSRFSRVRLCVTPQMAAHQAPPSLGFSRQEHWSGLPLPSPMHESEK